MPLSGHSPSFRREDWWTAAADAAGRPRQPLPPGEIRKVMVTLLLLSFDSVT